MLLLVPGSGCSLALQEDGSSSPGADTLVGDCADNLMAPNQVWDSSHATIALDSDQEGDVFHVCPESDGVTDGYYIELEALLDARVGDTYRFQAAVRATHQLVADVSLKIEDLQDNDLCKADQDVAVEPTWSVIDAIDLTVSEAGPIVQPKFEIAPTSDCFDVTSSCLVKISP